MQPKHRTPHIPQPQMQPIPIPQINRRHTNPLAAILARIIFLQLCDPEISHFAGAIWPETGVDKKRSEVRTRLKVWG